MGRGVGGIYYLMELDSNFILVDLEYYAYFFLIPNINLMPLVTII